MRISCYFCGREGLVEDTAEALEMGWYTHAVTTTYISIGTPNEIEPHSMGFVCPVCVAAFADR